MGADALSALSACLSELDVRLAREENPSTGAISVMRAGWAALRASSSTQGLTGRTIATLTEDSRATYGWRCATCHTVDLGVTHLHLAAEWAHAHTVATGHATTVEVEG